MPARWPGIRAFTLSSAFVHGCAAGGERRGHRGDDVRRSARPLLHHARFNLAETLARRVALSVENARLYRGAQDALRARDEFLSIAAHEIRGPITSMQLVVQGLRRGRLPAEAQERALAIVERESARLSRFVDELLDVGQVRAGQLRFNFQEVDLARLLATSLRGVARRSRAQVPPCPSMPNASSDIGTGLVSNRSTNLLTQRSSSDLGSRSRWPFSPRADGPRWW